MQIKNTGTNYGVIAKLFHWLIFLLILTMLIIGYCLDDIQDKALFVKVINIHKLIGLSILTLMIFRLIWALINTKPKLPFNTPHWQIYAEHFVHYAIYLVLFAMPIAGWVMSVAAGHTPMLFGMPISLPISESKSVAGIFKDIHNSLAIVIIVLVSIHILAALYHYFIKKDQVLQRML